MAVQCTDDQSEERSMFVRALKRYEQGAEIRFISLPLAETVDVALIERLLRVAIARGADTVKYLGFPKAELPDHIGYLVAELIAVSTSLKRVVVNGNKFGWGSMRAIAHAMARTPSVKILSLENNVCDPATEPSVQYAFTCAAFFNSANLARLSSAWYFNPREHHSYNIARDRARTMSHPTMMDTIILLFLDARRTPSRSRQRQADAGQCLKTHLIK